MANKLQEAFQQSTQQISGHGKRNVDVLKQVFKHIDGDTASDIYGNGEVIENFQTKMANYLGKESSVFFPSGTMAQQIALRLWSDEKQVSKVAYHPLCHLEIHEENGLKELHPVEVVLVGDKDRVISFEDVQSLPNGVACLLYELPQREIGGQLPEWDELVAISDYCRAHGIAFHLDGARLYEILPYYEKTAQEVCDLFDSVYVSFYKGIGGIAGAILAGNSEFIAKSKVWKRRYGGDLISLYPYILTADAYFDERIDKMPTYYKGAKKLAERFNECVHTTTLPEIPVSNMFHVHFSAPNEQMEELLATITKKTHIGLSGYVKEFDDQTCGFEVSVGDQLLAMSDETLDEVFTFLCDGMKEFRS